VLEPSKGAGDSMGIRVMLAELGKQLFEIVWKLNMERYPP
jgi:hypothetical protein